MVNVVINGIDISKMINQHRVSFLHEARSGKNGGMMLDGSITLDVIAWKLVATFELNALTEAEMQTIMALCRREYVTAQVYDNRTGTDRTAEFLPSLDEQRLAFEKAGVKYFYNGTLLTLRER